MAGLAEEYARHIKGAKLLTVFSVGQQANREGKGMDDARLSIVVVFSRGKFRQFLGIFYLRCANRTLIDRLTHTRQQAASRSEIAEHANT